MKNTLEAKLAYRESAVRGATPIELVVILFDAAIDDMRRAASAIQAGDIEQRATAIRHAMLVLQQLQGTLDFEKGGQVAKRFEQFYNLIRAKLLESQLRNSPELVQQPIRFMSEVRDCWMHAAKQLQPKPNPAAVAATIASAGATAEEGGPNQRMERIDQNVHLDILRHANASLLRFFDRSGTPVSGTSEEVEALLQLEETLESVGVLLDRGVQNIDNLAIREELALYRENLVALHRELSVMRDEATAFRARLYSRQDHLQAVKAWCVASRDTR